MRSVCVVVGLLSIGSAGCFQFPKASRTAFLERYNPFGAASAKPGERVILRSCLLDQPLGDAYLSHDLWANTLKPIGPEKAALLAENGLRVGVFATNTPSEFLERVNSSAATLRPTDSTISKGEAKLIATNGPVPSVLFASVPVIGAEPKQWELETAEFAWSIVATQAEAGKWRLSFEPRIQHGSRQGWLRPTADGTAFTRADQKAQEAFPSLQFEVVLAPGEFLVLGATEQPAGKLGGACFITQEADRQRMRVLVVRAWPAPTQTITGPSAPGRKLPSEKQP